MSNIEKYEGITAFHPGYYVEEAIQDMKISQGELAKRLGVSERTLSLFVDGQIDVSYKLAERLSMVLGTSIKFWFNLENGKYDGCRMYNRNSTLQKRADWIMEDLINNGAAWIDGFNRKLKEDFIDASIPEQILQELNVKRLTNAKFQHLDWEVKNINRELYIQAENNYHEKFKQVYGLEYECVCEVLSKIYCINRRVKKLAREEELRLAKLDRKNAHSVFDPFHVTHYHRDKRQGYRARRKRY